MTIRKVEMDFQYMSPIFSPPVKKDQLRGNAVSNDGVTVNHWRDRWIDQAKENHKNHGPFKDSAIDKLFNLHQYKPCIIAGSGPSLKRSVEGLKKRGGIPLVSCLHNFHLFEENGVDVDFYVSLDAGDIVIKEVSEGGRHDEGWYWENTENKTLLAYIASPPELIDKWRGDIMWFNCPVPDDKVQEAHGELEPFSAYVSTGGNVLGACMYIAKIMGCNPVTFVGADFSFSYTNKFHSWDSSYDKDLGNYMRAIDVYGNSVKTWQSYYNFKCFFDWLSMTVPGIYINCTEGGTLGS